jgi:hypothetical protein
MSVEDAEVSADVPLSIWKAGCQCLAKKGEENSK